MARTAKPAPKIVPFAQVPPRQDDIPAARSPAEDPRRERQEEIIIDKDDDKSSSAGGIESLSEEEDRKMSPPSEVTGRKSLVPALKASKDRAIMERLGRQAREDSDHLILQSAPTNYDVFAQAIFRTLGYFSSNTKSKFSPEETYLRDVFYTFGCICFDHMYKLTLTVLEKSRPCKGHAFSVVLAVNTDIRVVFSWIMSNPHEFNKGDFPYEPELTEVASRLNHQAIMRSIDDRPIPGGVLPKLSGDDQDWICWKTDALGIFAQYGLTDVIRSRVIAEFRPRSNAMVYGMIKSALSNMLTSQDIHYFTKNVDIPEDGHGAWRLLCQQFEQNNLMTYHMHCISNKLKTIKVNHGESILKFNMRFTALRNILHAHCELAKSKDFSIVTSYTSNTEREWVQLWSGKLIDTPFDRYRIDVMQLHPDNLTNAMNEIRKLVLDDQLSIDSESLSSGNRGKKRSNDTKDNRPAKARSVQTQNTQGSATSPMNATPTDNDLKSKLYKAMRAIGNPEERNQALDRLDSVFGPPKSRKTGNSNQGNQPNKHWKRKQGPGENLPRQPVTRRQEEPLDASHSETTPESFVLSHNLDFI